jgi:hypothetical protein
VSVAPDRLQAAVAVRWLQQFAQAADDRVGPLERLADNDQRLVFLGDVRARRAVTQLDPLAKPEQLVVPLQPVEDGMPRFGFMAGPGER